jgi:hypothetical protein
VTVPAREVSRFARNSREWQKLVEVCRVVDTLLIDQEMVYTPRQSNDRLLLGLKSSLNEYELDLLRQRSVEARREKAKRGELIITSPAGYIKGEDRLEKDPDLRVQERVLLVFSKFVELGSARQTLLWFLEHGLQVPVSAPRDQVLWRRPRYTTIYKMLTNPVYAGAYAYGRTERSYDESLWPADPWYDPKRDPVTRVLESRKGQPVHELEQLTVEVRRDINTEYMKRAKAFLKRSTDAGKPFFLYFNHSMMHLPVIPRAEFKGKTGHGDWADSLLELDTDFGTLLDYLNQLGAANNTFVVFSGDNGPGEAAPWRGTAGYFEGSYFTGMEGSLRTPALVRYPGHAPAGQTSNEIVHITDMFTTLLLWTGLEIPKDRVIDGVDQRAFFEGKQAGSNREGFLYWLGSEIYGVKWRNFKLVMVEQKTLTDPALPLPNPHLINLDTDPKEREPLDYPYLHTWVGAHVAKLLLDYQESLKHEPLIPLGAPLDYVPKQKQL